MDGHTPKDPDPFIAMRRAIARRLRELRADDDGDDLQELAHALCLWCGAVTLNVAGLAGERMGIIGMADAGDDQVDAVAWALAAIVYTAIDMQRDGEAGPRE
jgi:hypothetical protein